MRNTTRVASWLIVCWLGVLALPAAAQDDDRYETAGVDALIGSMDVLLDNYTRTLARKYDLTDEQADYTKYIMRQKANQFLEGREDRVRLLLGRMFAVRGGGDMSQDELMQWGQEMRPVFEAAKEVIVQGNDEFREILSEDQRRIHDGDLALMEESFAETEAQLNQIETGEMTVAEFRNPPRPGSRRGSGGRVGAQRATRLDQSEVRRNNSVAGRMGGANRQDREASVKPEARDEAARAKPRTPTATPRPPVREPARPGAPAPAPARADERAPAREVAPAKPGWESDWEKYVADFIKKYDLNDEQQQRANSVLEDCKQQAHRYLDSRKSRMEAMEKQLAELQKSKDRDKAKDVAKLREALDDMRKPITQIFERQLKPRLEKLPTRAQRKAAEAPKPKAGNKKD